MYRNPISADQDCEHLDLVARVLRGAYTYPDKWDRRTTPREMLEKKKAWEKLPKKFDVHREDEDACRDELWWAAGSVLAKNYSEDTLKRNGVRTIITLTRRDDSVSTFQ